MYMCICAFEHSVSHELVLNSNSNSNLCSMADFPHKRRVAGVGESDGVLYVVSGLGKSNTLYTQFLRGFFLACCYTFSNQLAAVTLKLNMTAESPAWEQVGAQSQDNLVRR